MLFYFYNAIDLLYIVHFKTLVYCVSEKAIDYVDSMAFLEGIRF